MIVPSPRPASSDRGLRLPAPREPRRQLRAPGLRLVLAPNAHYPDVFCAAILNAQPMGFYAPAQLVRDAVDHGVEVREVDVNRSRSDAALEPRSTAAPDDRGPPRLPPGQGSGRAGGGPAPGRRPAQALPPRWRRSTAATASAALVARGRRLPLARPRPPPGAVAVAAGTGPCLSAHADGQEPAPIEGGDSPGSSCPRWAWASMCWRTARLRLSLKAHPLALLRDWLAKKRAITARQLWHADPGRRVTVLRPGPGPSAPRERQRRHLRHPRGRDRLRQPRPLAQPLRAVRGVMTAACSPATAPCSARAASSMSSPNA